MSIELPEATILTEQMNAELPGKNIKSFQLQNYERLQRIGMLNKDISAFDQLINRKIESIESRGNTIRVKLEDKINLLLTPEYGGKILYHTDVGTVPQRFHLKVEFTDDTALTVRLTSMGLIFVMKDDDLKHSYVFRRDYDMQVLSPIEKDFTLNSFSQLLKENNRMLKSVLVGKDAIVVGLSNSAFQDIIYRAKLSPKRKAAELNMDEKQALYEAIRLLIQERIRLKGKAQFHDLYGKQGRYMPAMGPNMKQQTCPECDAAIQKMSVGGGQVYYCPQCQV